MKQRMIIVAAMAILGLTGCSDDPVTTVKKTVLSQYDSSVSLGKVLDTYSSCQPNTAQWREIKTERGQSFVQFSCVDTQFPTFMQKQVRVFLDVFRKHPIVPESAVKDIDAFVNWAEWMVEFGRVLFGKMGMKIADPEVDKLKSIDITEATFVVKFAKNLTTEKYEFNRVGYDVTYRDARIAEVSLPSFVLEACYRNEPVMKIIESKNEDISSYLIDGYKRAKAVEKPEKK